MYSQFWQTKLVPVTSKYTNKPPLNERTKFRAQRSSRRYGCLFVCLWTASREKYCVDFHEIFTKCS